MTELQGSPKRGRGRPVGTGIDDTITLRAVADLLVQQPSLLPTSAIKRVKRGILPSPLRRLQQKWHDRGEQLLLEAAARQRAISQRKALDSYRTAVELMAHYPKPAFDELCLSPAMQAALEPIRILPSQGLSDAVISTTTSLSAFHNSPTFQALRNATVDLSSIRSCIPQYPDLSFLQDFLKLRKDT